MTAIRQLFAAVLVLGSLCFLPGTARAAETYHTCAGFIDALPATISTQGVWCLRHDLNTGMANGNAITIAGNNITIDCNDFKIGGLAAGDASTTLGIFAQSRQNVTVRHCNVRGFFYGIWLDGGAGHLVEDNRLDNNLLVGIFINLADNSLVQRNRVFDTGGSPGLGNSYGIWASADLLDNTVSGVFANATDTNPIGILATGRGTTVQGNRVRGLAVAGAGLANGIEAIDGYITIDGNQVTANVGTPGSGINGLSSICNNNTAVNFSSNYSNCTHTFNNASLPSGTP